MTFHAPPRAAALLLLTPRPAGSLGVMRGVTMHPGGRPRWGRSEGSRGTCLVRPSAGDGCVTSSVPRGVAQGISPPETTARVRHNPLARSAAIAAARWRCWTSPLKLDAEADGELRWSRGVACSWGRGPCRHCCLCCLACSSCCGCCLGVAAGRALWGRGLGLGEAAVARSGFIGSTIGADAWEP